MRLSSEQISHFTDQGWVAVPGFFDARETAALQAEVRRLQEAGLLRNVATAGDGRTVSRSVANLQICPCSPHSPLILALRSAPAVTSAVRALIGDPLAFVLDQIFLKPGGHGAGTRWHQDAAYWNLPPECHVHGTGMWIAVHAATRANGTMRVVPRSHIRLEPHERDPGSDHHIHAPVVDESRAVMVELPPGGVLFFNFGILHCTGANRSDRERAGLALHFANRGSMPERFLADFAQARLTGGDGALDPDAPPAAAWEREVGRILAGA